MKRTFVAYAMYWRPPETRCQILKHYDLRFIDDRAVSAFTGIPLSIVPEYHPELLQFLLAYARDGGKFNFQLSENEWKFCNTIRYVEALKLEFMRCTVYNDGRSMRLGDILDLTIIPIGIQRKTRLFRHTWLALQVTLELDVLIKIIREFEETFKGILLQRRQNPKFGFLRKVRLPATPEEYRRAPDEVLSVAFEGLIRLMCDRPETRDNIRESSMTRLFDLLSPSGRLTYLQPLWHADERIHYVLTHEDCDAFKQLKELEQQAELMRPLRSRGTRMWASNKIPCTVITQIDAILQEVTDEALHQRQQRKVRESSTSNPAT